MKLVQVLILDDNFVIARTIRRRLFEADGIYKHGSGVQIVPHWLEVDNEDPQKAAEMVNDYMNRNNVHYLLLDRGFSVLSEGTDPQDSSGKTYIFRDGTKGMYFVEQMLGILRGIPGNKLQQVKGVIVYTYDDYKQFNKYGEMVKEEIVSAFGSILPSTCKLDVLLSYSNIYRVAEIDLYDGWEGTGVIRLGRKDNFVLYALFVGELLYHKLILMIDKRRVEATKTAKRSALTKLIAFFLIYISLSLGVSSLFEAIDLQSNHLTNAILLISFAVLLPLVILWLRPALLIDIDD